ncbi:hypothetical protein ACRALDRAFT_208779 [Sodiomyces alcalophilus JCM 7366]|uniref:uncharacterized protein n=1 Tax=Sodiomyces alcalophilus JCM 7366 TaxID=591952 RepID=UPI0039B4EDBA
MTCIVSTNYDLTIRTYRQSARTLLIHSMAQYPDLAACIWSTHAYDVARSTKRNVKVRYCCISLEQAETEAKGSTTFRLLILESRSSHFLMFHPAQAKADSRILAILARLYPSSVLTSCSCHRTGMRKRETVFRLPKIKGKPNCYKKSTLPSALFPSNPAFSKHATLPLLILAHTTTEFIGLCRERRRPGRYQSLSCPLSDFDINVSPSLPNGTEREAAPAILLIFYSFYIATTSYLFITSDCHPFLPSGPISMYWLQTYVITTTA